MSGEALAETRRVLVVGAHPDDIEFGAAGTIALWTDEGWDVRYVIATRGERGVQDPQADLEAVARMREEESRKAAAICGVTNVTFLGYPDAQTAYGQDLLRDLARQFRLHQPHRLVTLSPDVIASKRWLNHPDHRAVGAAMLDTVLTGGTTGAIFPELAIDERLAAWRGLQDVWVMTGDGDTAVDVSTSIDRKIAALEAHRSQVGDWDVATGVRQWLAATGAAYGYAYAEVFRVIDLLRE